MLFDRTHRFNSKLSVEDIKSRLIGKHVRIHNLDFEIYEKDNRLKIIPHAEQEEAIKTLPITRVYLSPNGTGTDVKLSSHMRRIDAGGPMMIVGFSLFMLLGAMGFYLLGGETYTYYALALFVISVLIFSILMIRLSSGYFDYVGKVKNYVKTTLN